MIFCYLCTRLVCQSKFLEKKRYACLVDENVGNFHLAQEFAWRVPRILRGLLFTFCA